MSPKFPKLLRLRPPLTANKVNNGLNSVVSLNPISISKQLQVTMMVNTATVTRRSLFTHSPKEYETGKITSDQSERANSGLPVDSNSKKSVKPTSVHTKEAQQHGNRLFTIFDWHKPNQEYGMAHSESSLNRSKVGHGTGQVLGSRPDGERGRLDYGGGGGATSNSSSGASSSKKASEAHTPLGAFMTTATGARAAAAAAAAAEAERAAAAAQSQNLNYNDQQGSLSHTQSQGHDSGSYSSSNNSNDNSGSRKVKFTKKQDRDAMKGAVLTFALFIMLPCFAIPPMSEKYCGAPYYPTWSDDVDEMLGEVVIRLKKQKEVLAMNGSSSNSDSSTKTQATQPLTLLDIGSGDGRIVYQAAKRGFSKVYGIEVNPFLHLIAKIRGLLNVDGLTKEQRKRVRLVWGNIWEWDGPVGKAVPKGSSFFSSLSVITVYGTVEGSNGFMDRLGEWLLEKIEYEGKSPQDGKESESEAKPDSVGQTQSLSRFGPIVVANWFAFKGKQWESNFVKSVGEDDNLLMYQLGTKIEHFGVSAG